MRQIHIATSVNNDEEMVDLLREIARMIDGGYKSGYDPHWTLTGDIEKPKKVTE